MWDEYVESMLKEVCEEGMFSFAKMISKDIKTL